MIDTQALKQAVKSISIEIFGNNDKLVIPEQLLSEKIKLLNYNSTHSAMAAVTDVAEWTTFIHEYQAPQMRDFIEDLCALSNVTIVSHPQFLSNTLSLDRMCTRPINVDNVKLASFSGFIAGVTTNKNKHYFIFQLKPDKCCRYIAIDN